MKKLSAVLFLALGFLDLTGQAQIKLNNLGLGVSYWEGSYSDIDEESFLANYEGEGFFKKGAAMPYVSAELNLWRSISLDARLALWNSNFESEDRYDNGLVISDKLEQTIIPVSVGLLYRASSLFMTNFDLFAGAGLNRYFIQNKVSREVSGGTGSVSPETFSGNNYGFNLKAGLEYYFSRSLGLSLEGRYNTGSYNMNYQLDQDGPVVTNEVSLQGLEIGLGLKYRFNATPAQTTAAPTPVNDLEQ